MAKERFLIKAHSFIDVITNSSTELFICDTDKTVEFVKEQLLELLRIYNMKAELMGWNPLKYDDILEEPFERDTEIVIYERFENSIPYCLGDDITYLFNAVRCRE